MRTVTVLMPAITVTVAQTEAIRQIAATATRAITKTEQLAQAVRPSLRTALNAMDQLAVRAPITQVISRRAPVALINTTLAQVVSTVQRLVFTVRTAVHQELAIPALTLTLT